MAFRSLKRLAKRISRKENTRTIIAFAGEIPAKASVLNIGAGGQVQRIIEESLRHEDIILISTDIDPKRRPDIVDDITSSKLEDESFDFIICSEVLEHVKEPQSAVDNFFRLLKPGGKCLVTVPFLFPTHDAPHDYFRYTEFGLRHLFTSFKILDMRSRNTWWETVLLLKLRMLWFANFRTQVMIAISSLVFILLIPLFVLFSGKGVWPAMTSGFIIALEKPKK